MNVREASEPPVKSFVDNGWYYTYDTQNPDAWLMSDVTAEVEP